MSDVQVWRSLAEVPSSVEPGRGLGPTVVAIGVFDGVHRGHRAVVQHARAAADVAGLPLVVLTFDPIPMSVLRPASAPPMVGSLEHRVRLLGAAGADAVLVVPFDLDVAAQSPETFVDETLVRHLHVVQVVVGEDFRFGHRAVGDVATLRALGETRGFTVQGLPAVGVDGQRWSSTEVRRLVADGQVQAAADVLGHRFRLEGVVVPGDARGRELGYPTANLAVPAGRLLPGDGVYAAWLYTPGEASPLPAAVSVGTNPTFDGAGRRAEAHVLGREDLDLYGQPVALDFVERLRGMVRFGHVDELLEAMADDVHRTAAALGVGR